MPLHERFLPRQSPQVPGEKGTPFALSNGLGRFFVARETMTAHGQLTTEYATDSEEDWNEPRHWQFGELPGEQMMRSNGIRSRIPLLILPLPIPEGNISGHNIEGKAFSR